MKLKPKIKKITNFEQNKEKNETLKTTKKKVNTILSNQTTLSITKKQSV